MKFTRQYPANKALNSIFLLFSCLALITINGTAMADATQLPPPPDLGSRSYVLMDFASGQVLAAKAANQRLQPASLTKLMTAYLTFEGLKRGTLKMDEPIPVSTEAWKTGGSRMFIQPRLPVTVNQLIQGLVVVSGNDAAVALSEAIGGEPGSFVQLMNSTAQNLGMKSTHYVDVNGLPNANHYSSAYDIALLSRDIIKEFPQQLHFFGEKTFTYNNITQNNWNPLVFKDASVDGMKTGHTDEAGYCLDATAERQNRRLIAVVMGARTRSASAEDAEALLNYGFRNYESALVVPENQKIGTLSDVHLDPMTIAVGSARPFYVAVPVGDKNRIKVALALKAGRNSAIAKGQVVGSITATIDGKTIASVPAVALDGAKKAGFLPRMWNQIMKWV
jgi:serine-type D-Ala-D-Ala carboxypeptidase (penicillin-binding protein 5/6)